MDEVFRKAGMFFSGKKAKEERDSEFSLSSGV